MLREIIWRYREEMESQETEYQNMFFEEKFENNSPKFEDSLTRYFTKDPSTKGPDLSPSSLLQNNRSDFSSSESEFQYFSIDSLKSRYLAKDSPTTVSDLTPTTFARNNTSDSMFSRNEFQYYIIAVYSFFAVLFSIALIIIILRKLKKACCSSWNEEDDFDYHHTPSNENFDPNDNMGFEHHVNVDNLDIENRTEGNASDYDYYSDDGAQNIDTESAKEKPPAYEGPPPYTEIENK